MTTTNTGQNLAALILDRKGDRSFSKLSEDCGGQPAGRRLQQFATRPIKNFPDPETIPGLARGLGVTTTEVILASARSLGIKVTASDAEALTLADAGKLPTDAQEALQQLTRAMLKMNSGDPRVRHLRPVGARPSEEELTQQWQGMAAFKTPGEAPPMGR